MPKANASMQSTSKRSIHRLLQPLVQNILEHIVRLLPQAEAFNFVDSQLREYAEYEQDAKK